MKYTPKPYQASAIHALVERPEALLLALPGRGKTSVALTALVELRDAFEVTSVLVVAPKAVCYNVWRQEGAKWDHTRHLTFQLLHGPKKAEAAGRPADVYLINPEGLRWLESTWKGRRKLSLPNTLLIDESSKFRHPGRARWRAMRRLSRNFIRRYAMTGTPAPNGLEGLYGQALLLDGGRALGATQGAFRKRFCVPIINDAGYPEWCLRDGAEEDIYAALRPLAIRMGHAGDDVELPPLEVIDIPVDLPKSARELYRQLRREMIAELPQGELIAKNAGAAGIKCRQITNGRVFLSDLPGGGARAPDGVAGGRPYARVHGAKAEAVERLVSELGGRSVLFTYEFAHDLHTLHEALGVRVPILRGTDVAMVEAWNRGELRYMAAHPASCGHGLNLQSGGHVMIMLGPPWDLELYKQVCGRLQRPGQRADHVLVYRLIARGTDDRRIARALSEKGATEDALMRALLEGNTQ